MGIYICKYSRHTSSYLSCLLWDSSFTFIHSAAGTGLWLVHVVRLSNRFQVYWSSRVTWNQLSLVESPSWRFWLKSKRFQPRWAGERRFELEACFLPHRSGSRETVWKERGRESEAGRWEENFGGELGVWRGSLWLSHFWHTVNANNTYSFNPPRPLSVLGVSQYLFNKSPCFSL